MGENKLPFPQLVILPDFWTNQQQYHQLILT